MIGRIGGRGSRGWICSMGAGAAPKFDEKKGSALARDDVEGRQNGENQELGGAEGSWGDAADKMSSRGGDVWDR